MMYNNKKYIMGIGVVSYGRTSIEVDPIGLNFRVDYNDIIF